jgi:Tol biopolymer transport system component
MSACQPGATSLSSVCSLGGFNWDEPVNLTNHEYWDFDPAYSPDGSLVAFHSVRPPSPLNRGQIYVMNADGSAPRALTNTEATNYGAAWSPDGRRIAFVTERDGDPEVYVMNADGTSPTNLTNNPGGYDSGPDWSPDGRYIAYFSGPDRPQGSDEIAPGSAYRYWNADIYIMDVETGERTRVTHADNDDVYPVWSHDGTRLAFTSSRDGNNEIYVINADGTGLRRVTESEDQDNAPQWLPGDGCLSYNSNHYLSGYRNEDDDGEIVSNIYVVDLATGATSQVTDRAGTTYFNGELSSDGERFIYAAFTDDETAYRDERADIYVVERARKQSWFGTPPGGGPSFLTVEAWREDLSVMVDQVLLRHPNPFHYGAPESEYRAAAAELSNQIPQLSDSQIVLGMIRIHAMLRDAHSEPNWPAIDDRFVRWEALPFQLTLDPEGYFVSATVEGETDLIGYHVTHFGSVPLAEVYRRLRPYVTGDNEWNRSTVAVGLMTVPHLLQLLGVVEDAQTIKVRLRSPTGEAIERRFTPVDGQPEWIDASAVAEQPLPLWLKDRGNLYWFEYLEPDDLMYVQINQMRDKSDEPMAEFAERLFRAVEERRPEKLVIDLRHNRGGVNSVYWPLIHRLALSSVNADGRLFVITGRGTRSAAPSFVARLEDLTEVIVVGEPTAGRPNGHGGASQIVLPNSGLQLTVSGLFIRPTLMLDNRPWIAPLLSADLTALSYSSNVDPALQAIRQYEPTPGLVDWLGGDWHDDVPGLAERYADYRRTPGNRWRGVGGELVGMAEELIEAGRIEDAMRVLELALAEYPDDWRVHEGLGVAFESLDMDAEAEVHYARAFALNRVSQRVLRRLNAMRQRRGAGGRTGSGEWTRPGIVQTNR